MTNTILETALSWHSHGVAPIPCAYQTKRPIVPWRRWQNELPSASLVKQWFGGNVNLALVCGGTGHLAVLDFDAWPTYYYWQQSHPDLANAYTVTTGRPGWHVYLRTPASKPTSSMSLPGLDIRADGGLVMAPPSVHPTGTPYRDANAGNILTVTGVADAVDLPQNSVKGKGGLDLPFSFTEFRTSGGDLVHKVRSAFPILAYLGAYTEPIRSSRGEARWFVMRCPHPGHPDLNPSFWCDAERGICGCFKPECKASQPNGKPMDTINLHGWLTGLSNFEALRDLARKVGFWHDTH